MPDKEDVIGGVHIHHSNHSIWLKIRIGDVQSVLDSIDSTVERRSEEDDFDGDAGAIAYWDEVYFSPEDAVLLGAALIKLGNKLGARNYTEAEISLGLIRLGKCTCDKTFIHSPATRERQPVNIGEVILYRRTEAHCEHYRLYLNGSNQSPQCGTCSYWTPTDQYV